MADYGKAVELVQVVSGSEVRLLEDAKGKLCRERFPRPLVVVTFSGVAGTGKSTQANMFLAKLGIPVEWLKVHGFGVSDASRAEGGFTQGAWFFDQPLPHPTVPGLDVLVVDMEGTAQGNDAVTLVVTALAAYAASLFVYRTPSLANSDLDSLAAVAAVARFDEGVEGGSNGNDGQELLIQLYDVDDMRLDTWRDEFGLAVDQDRFTIGDAILDDWKESASNGRGTGDAERVDSVVSAFPSIALVPLPEPSDEEEEDFPDVPTGSPFGTAFDAMFARAMELSTTPRGADGDMAFAFFDEIVTSINTRGSVDIRSLRERIVEAALESAASAASGAFVAICDAGIGSVTTQSALDALFAQAQQASHIAARNAIATGIPDSILLPRIDQDTHLLRPAYQSALATSEAKKAQAAQSAAQARAEAQASAVAQARATRARSTQQHQDTRARLAQVDNQVGEALKVMHQPIPSGGGGGGGGGCIIL